MRLYIDLTPQEESDIHGWVNKGLAEPEFANYPWRIVLAERSRARFDQIAAQFGAIGPTPPQPPAPPPTPQPWQDFCNVNEDIRWTVPWGDMVRRATRDIRDFRFNNVCLAFTVPPEAVAPFQRDGYVSFTEFDGSPITRHMTLSRSACDFRPVDPTGINGPLGESYGKQVTLDFNVLQCRSQTGIALQPGGSYFVNLRNWSPEKNAPSPPPIEEDWITLDNGTQILRSYAAGGSFIWPRN